MNKKAIRYNRMNNVRLKHTESQQAYPNTMKDNDRNNSYMRGQFLGMGSFGKCFVAKEISSGKSYAAKILNKHILNHPMHSYFLLEELAIHRLLRHKNIVTFYQAFEDENFIYIILELCCNGTLMELQKRRQSITLIESKYYIYQIISGVHYLHRKCIVHGDLKLSNIFLNNRMMVKIGDFGLATALSFEGEEIKIQCGTPNYMAPEIVEKKGHSYAGDVWAIGCILYGLLVGKLPFQSSENQMTYDKITNCDFSVYVPGLRKKVSQFIRKILQREPEKRPSIEELKNDEFLQGYIPQTLPEYCLWEPLNPRDLMRGKPHLLKFSTSSHRHKSISGSNRRRRKSTITRLRSGHYRQLLIV